MKLEATRTESRRVPTHEAAIPPEPFSGEGSANAKTATALSMKERCSDASKGNAVASDQGLLHIVMDDKTDGFVPHCPNLIHQGERRRIPFDLNEKRRDVVSIP